MSDFERNVEQAIQRAMNGNFVKDAVSFVWSMKDCLRCVLEQARSAGVSASYYISVSFSDNKKPYSAV